jgi:hypothetical protein
MASDFSAIIFFWLPGITLVTCAFYSLLKKNELDKKRGVVGAFVCLILVLVSPWTITESDSSAFGHLLGVLIGPLVLILMGMYNIIFSIQPGKFQIAKDERMLGQIMLFFGILWLFAYHWIGFTPSYDGEVNRYWIIFLTTILILSPLLFFAFAILVSVLGHERKNVSWYMGFIGFVAFQILIITMVLDGSSISSLDFSQHLVVSLLEIIGYGIGFLLAAIVFSIVISIYERSIPMMAQLEPPNPEELKYAREIIKLHLEGGLEDE